MTAEREKLATERAMAGLEAQADIWAEEVRLVDMVKAMGDVSRGLTDRMPTDVRNTFIDRQEAQIDAIARQAYLEGFYRGGESRKERDAATTPSFNDAIEAAAKVAERDTRSELAKEHHYEPIWYRHGKAIAKAIRALSPAQAPGDAMTTEATAPLRAFIDQVSSR